MSLQVPLDAALTVLLLFGRDPAAFAEQFGQRAVLARGPGSANFGELVVVDESRLESEDSEQEITVGVQRRRGLRRQAVFS